MTRRAAAVVPALPSGTTATNLYPRAWACWAAGVLGSFAAIEAIALVRAPGHGTLTAQLRRRRAISAAGIALFGAWATAHIGWQGHGRKETR
ncbi:hypothetical protein ACIBEJ_34500 [Nonomuraea sp. NPDC050790]|uniref:hypothetical protein n=1 Tax=Nonomuraea sp. NPDC050790 TaxID=3364371 RepID=UPI0037A5D5D0